MLASESPITTTMTHPIHHPKSGGARIPLQPKNTLPPPPTSTTSKPKRDYVHGNTPLSISSPIHNKENIFNPIPLPLDAMDSSLAEELTAVKRRLERLRVDGEKTEKMLIQRDRLLNLKMVELEHSGELQKELEIQVDRLYRLNQLHLASVRRSPIRSLREKEMEKESKQIQPNKVAKTVESKDELVDHSSSTDSPASSFEFSSLASTSALTANSTSASSFESSSASTSTSKTNSVSGLRKSPIPFRWSLESADDK